MKPSVFGRKNTRAQWLASYKPQWRWLMSKIKEGPDEVAAKSGVSKSTVLLLLRKNGDISSRKYRAILATILTSMGFDVNADNIEKEGSHMLDLEYGKEPHEDVWRGASRPIVCRLCSSHRREQIEASLARQAQAIVSLRTLMSDFAHEHALTKAEMTVVFHATEPHLPKAVDLAESLRLFGFTELANKVLMKRPVRPASNTGKTIKGASHAA